MFSVHKTTAAIKSTMNNQILRYASMMHKHTGAVPFMVHTVLPLQITILFSKSFFYLFQTCQPKEPNSHINPKPLSKTSHESFRSHACLNKQNRQIRQEPGAPQYQGWPLPAFPSPKHNNFHGMREKMAGMLPP